MQQGPTHASLTRYTQCINNIWVLKVGATISRWGNSLGLRVPKPIAEQIGLREGSTVNLTIENGHLVVTPARRSLDDLLADITPENLHGEIDDGIAVGQEVW